MVPADHKWYRNLVVGRITAAVLDALDPRWPDVDPEIGRFALDELEQFSRRM